MAKINSAASDYGNYADLFTRLSSSTSLLKDIVPSQDQIIDTAVKEDEIAEKSDDNYKGDYVGDDSKEDASSSDD